MIVYIKLLLSLCAPHRYSVLKTLDDLCLHIGNANLSGIKQEIKGSIPCQLDDPVFVHIVTKLDKSGGHTRVLEDFIKARRRGSHVILSTELDGKSDTNYLRKTIAQQVNLIIEKAPKVNYQQQLTWLQKSLWKSTQKRFIFSTITRTVWLSPLFSRKWGWLLIFIIMAIIICV